MTEHQFGGGWKVHWLFLVCLIIILAAIFSGCGPKYVPMNIQLYEVTYPNGKVVEYCAASAAEAMLKATSKRVEVKHLGKCPDGRWQ